MRRVGVIVAGFAVVVGCASPGNVSPSAPGAAPGEADLYWVSSDSDQTLWLGDDGDARIDGFWNIAPEDYPGACLLGFTEPVSASGTWRELASGQILISAQGVNWTVFAWSRGADPWSVIGYYPCGPDYSAPVLLNSAPAD